MEPAAHSEFPVSFVPGFPNRWWSRETVPDVRERPERRGAKLNCPTEGISRWRVGHHSHMTARQAEQCVSGPRLPLPGLGTATPILLRVVRPGREIVVGPERLRDRSN